LSLDVGSSIESGSGLFEPLLNLYMFMYMKTLFEIKLKN
jgi:hypothetical protein